MLEDELREMFAARVQTPPASVDPAGGALRHARRSDRRRRGVAAGATLSAFAAVVGGALYLQGMGGTAQPADPNRLSFQNLFGTGPAAATTAAVQAKTPQSPQLVDLLVGAQVWTKDGRKVNLEGGGRIGQIARVPDGWVYSEGSTVRVQSDNGYSSVAAPVVSSWAVSSDGSRIATVTQEQLTVTKVNEPGQGVPLASTTVPEGAHPVTFAGDGVVLTRDGAYDYWSAGPERYSETWHKTLVAVYASAADGKAVGVVRDRTTYCLADVTPTKTGLKLGQILGCEDWLAVGLGQSGVMSPDGQWLAITADEKVRIVDLQRTRAAAAVRINESNSLVVTSVCGAREKTPTVWTADSVQAVAETPQGGLIACRHDGGQLAVEMPDGVTPDWSLVPEYGTANG
ncbi:hypothetical protein Cs7R123_77420 [Catellatospora sp. TT07R-123]|uniref:hypothetical protein n=1 Tax=Catellatospora sp. TT07R-123 TaxID=2733863 RepID=UPI001B2D92A2|nr:hypothetical protein [Catellatospora sp. TT07R-123]GHJ50400.1 hypothetical protein Cs7R123_77420 [Catellatospora sp. TT07R-123]